MIRVLVLYGLELELLLHATMMLPGPCPRYTELCDLLRRADGALNGKWDLIIADPLPELVEPLLRKD